MKQFKKGPTQEDKKLGVRLRQFRLQNEMTQTELGATLDLTFQQIQKYEKGVNRIGAGRLIKICRVLNITPHQLLGAEPDGTLVHLHDACLKLGSTPAGVELALAFNRLDDPKQRNLVVLLAQTLATAPHTVAQTLTGT